MLSLADVAWPARIERPKQLSRGGNTRKRDRGWVVFLARFLGRFGPRIRQSQTRQQKGSRIVIVHLEINCVIELHNRYGWLSDTNRRPSAGCTVKIDVGER